MFEVVNYLVENWWLGILVAGLTFAWVGAFFHPDTLRDAYRAYIYYRNGDKYMARTYGWRWAAIALAPLTLLVFALMGALHIAVAAWVAIKEKLSE